MQRRSGSGGNGEARLEKFDFKIWQEQHESRFKEGWFDLKET